MAPSTSSSTINARLDFVDLFLGNEQLFYGVLEDLGRLPELDKTLAGLAVMARKSTKAAVTVSHASVGIKSLVCLKTVLQVIPSLVTILEAAIGDNQDEREKEQQQEQEQDQPQDQPQDQNRQCNLAAATFRRMDHPNSSSNSNSNNNSNNNNNNNASNGHDLQLQ